MTTTEQIADYEAQRAAAYARLARAIDPREVAETWTLIAWLDEQIRRLVLTPESAARMDDEDGRPTAHD